MGATGHDRRTVAKYIKAQQAFRYKSRPAVPSKLEPFKTIVACAAIMAAAGVLGFSLLVKHLLPAVVAHVLWSASIGSGASSHTALITELTPTCAWYGNGPEQLRHRMVFPVRRRNL